MSDAMSGTGVWKDTVEVSEAIAATLADRSGMADVARLMTNGKTRRVIASGNGASFYVAHALWLASFYGEARVEVVGLPAGLLCDATSSFRWRSGDLLLAVSSSGRLRDLIEIIDERKPSWVPYAAITANPDAPVPVGATACAQITVPTHRAVTHTGDFCAATAAALSIWSMVTGDKELAAAVDKLPETTRRSAGLALDWSQNELLGLDLPSTVVPFGSGPAWTAALEAALMVKEIAGISGEGLETREAATSALTATGPGHLFVALPTGDDCYIEEACRLATIRGARALSAPGGPLADPRVSPVTTFPAAIALSVVLGQRAAMNVDHPEWIDLYYSTARRDGVADHS